MDSYNELNDLIKVHEDFRYLNNRNQIKLVKGNIQQTLPEYLEKNKGTIISLLYCDLDLYEPTKFSLQLLWNRIPKGGIIVFDNAIMECWAGEAIAFNADGSRYYTISEKNQILEDFTTKGPWKTLMGKDADYWSRRKKIEVPSIYFGYPGSSGTHSSFSHAILLHNSTKSAC